MSVKKTVRKKEHAQPEIVDPDELQHKDELNYPWRRKWNEELKIKDKS